MKNNILNFRDDNQTNDSSNKFYITKLILKRARHVITENARVLKAKQCIINGDIKSFGNLMNESHQSYAKDFEASTEDVDLIVAKSITSGAEGARLTGGGFGGFTVSLIHKNKFDVWKKNMMDYMSYQWNLLNH